MTRMFMVSSRVLRTVDELAVGREDSLGEVEVVLEPDPHVGADHWRKCRVRQLEAADGEHRVHRTGRQVVDHCLQRGHVVWRAVGDAHAELHHARVVDQAFLDDLVEQDQVTGVEHLDLGLDAELLDALGHRAEHPGVLTMM